MIKIYTLDHEDEDEQYIEYDSKYKGSEEEVLVYTNGLIDNFIKNSVIGPNDFVVLSSFSMDSMGSSEGVYLSFYKTIDDPIIILREEIKNLRYDNDVICKSGPNSIEIFEKDGKRPCGFELQVVNMDINNSKVLMKFKCRSYVDNWHGPY